MSTARDKLDEMFGAPKEAPATKPTTVKEPGKPDIGAAERILTLLNKRSMTRDELSYESGLGDEGTAKALNYLMVKLETPYVVKQDEIRDRINNKVITHAQYFLTAEGKKNVPHKAAALKHFRGLNGKYRFDTAGNIILEGARGQVLEAIRQLKLPTQGEIQKHTGLTLTEVSIICGDLEDKLELVEYVHDGRVRRYKEKAPAKQEPRKAANDTHKVDPPNPQTELPDYAPTPIQKAMGEALSQDKMTTAIKGLIAAGYDPSDIIMTVLVEMGDELKSLREFHKQAMQLTSEHGA